jgi:hypothetical protein
MALAGVGGWAISRWLFSEDLQAPSWWAPALVGTASIYLVFELLRAFGMHVGYTGVGAALRDGSLLLLAVAAAMAVRYVPRKVAFLLGVLAMALQFNIGAVLSLGVLALPKWAPMAVSLAASAFIAWRLTHSDDSPADRVQGPGYLWAFGAAGTLAMLWSARIEVLPQFLGGGLFAHSTVWLLLGALVFFGIFMATASRALPADVNEEFRGSRASGATLLCVFLALYVVFALNFGIAVPLAVLMPTATWAPTVLCLAVALVLMFWMRLAVRIPSDAPGRGLIVAGLAAFAIAMVGGWRIVASTAGTGGFGPMLGIVFLLLLVAPLVAIGQTLVGIGLLRVMFNLDLAPETQQARAKKVARAAAR